LHYSTADQVLLYISKGGDKRSGVSGSLKETPHTKSHFFLLY